MSRLLGSYVHNRDNNFNLIRFIAASLVLYSHSFALTLGRQSPDPLKEMIGMTWGNIAVDLFFITSGFLITGSYFARNHILAFVWARCLRIYPGLVVALLFSVFVIGAFFTTLSLSDYFSDSMTFKYFLKNAVLFFGIEFNLPGVFADTPWPNAVNGSLWTLPYEVKMYVLLASLLVSFGYYQKKIGYGCEKRFLLIVAVISTIANMISHWQFQEPSKFLHLFSMFFVGAAYYVWRDKITISSKVFYPALTLLLLTTFDETLFFYCYVLFLPYLIFYIAYVPSGNIRKFNRLGDYSYGIYIYAYPVQQSIAALVTDLDVLTMIWMSFFFTLALAYLSWHLVEKKFLKLKDSYIHIEQFWLRLKRASNLA